MNCGAQHLKEAARSYPAPRNEEPRQACYSPPTIRGMRIIVAEVLEMLGSGMKEADILEAFPYLEAEDIGAALAYAAKYFDHPILAA